MVKVRKSFKRNAGIFFGCFTVVLLLIFVFKEEKSLYDQAFDVLMKSEGGYINHPSDPGGETKYGI